MKPVIAAHRDIGYQVPDIGLLLRCPDSLQGQRLTLRGRVVQTWDDEGEPTIILGVEGSPYPDNEVTVTLPQWEGPLPQGELTVCGVCRGTHLELHSSRCGVVARPHLEAELVQ